MRESDVGTARRVERQELEALIEAGLSIAQLAKALGRSKGSVRYWMTRYGLRTRNPSRRASRPAALEGRSEGLGAIVMECPAHGTSEFVLEGRGYYRCKQCRSESVTARRRRVKAVLVEEAGGRCLLCGYDRCQAALAFHHLDPAEKQFVVSANGNGVAIDLLRAEAAKCVLLCANCHAEVEGGLAAVPADHVTVLRSIQ